MMHVTSQEQATGAISRGVKSRRADLILNAVRYVTGFSVMVAITVAAPTHAQAPDPHGTTYGMGFLPASPAQLDHFPKAQELRAPIPRKTDLSGFMPPVGIQGLQASCVAWATGYALRAYYVAKMDKLNVSSPENVPSPAYIYNHANGDYGRDV